MSDFARGLILGGGNIFGESSGGGGGGGIDFEARNVNRDLKEQNRKLKAEIAGKDAVFEALCYSLREADPGHPMITPYERGENPLRQKILDTAYEKALADPDL